MKKAWVENSRIRDVCHGNPDECYHPDIAIKYDTDVPDDAENGDTFENGVLTKKPVIAAPEPVEPEVVQPTVSPVEFKLLFSSQERIAIKTSNDPIVQDFFELVNDPRLTQVNLALKSTQDALDYMTAVGLLAVGRKDEIVTGVAK